MPEPKDSPVLPENPKRTTVSKEENLKSNVRIAMAEMECPTARNSLLPYLLGRLDGTGEGAEFEAHVKKCDVCRELVSDRRRALQALIAAAETSEISNPARLSLPGLKESQVKLLAISGVLAIALIGVSYFIKPESSLLGDKFGDTMPVVQAPVYKNSGPAPDTRARFEETIETTSALASEPPPPVTEEPAKLEPPPASPKKQKKKLVKRTTVAVPNRVEVFDSQGNKVGEAIEPK